VPDTTGDAQHDVVPIDSIVDLDLDSQTDDVEDYPPFRIRVGGQTFSINQPDAGLVMEVEGARTTEVGLALIFDEQWPDVRAALAGKDPTAPVKIVRDWAEHFDLDQQGLMAAISPGNREERRQAEQQRRRRHATRRRR
jgi:hypothetical protein